MSTSLPTAAVRKGDDDADALHRLLRNLQASVPLCLLLTVYFPVSAARPRYRASLDANTDPHVLF